MLHLLFLKYTVIPSHPLEVDTLEVRIMTFCGKYLDCGLFEIDEICMSLPPDYGGYVPLGANLRSRNIHAFEKQSLRSIAGYFAGKHGLLIVGGEGKMQKIEVEKRTQDNETYIGFLTNLAKEFGIVFSIRGRQLVFVDIDELEGRDATAEFDRSSISTASFTEKTSQVYQSASIARRNMRKML
jgi:phage protein D